MIDHRYYNNTAVTDYASIDIQPGYQRLNGADALSWVRYRHDQNGDFTRIVRQQIFLREMKRELAGSAKLSSLPRFLSVMSILSHNVTSDISSLGKLYRLLTLALQLNTTHIYQTHIDGSTPMIGGISYVAATPQQVATAVHQFLHRRAGPAAGAVAARPASGAGAAGRVARGPGRQDGHHRLALPCCEVAGAAAVVAPAALHAGGVAGQPRLRPVPRLHGAHQQRRRELNETTKT